MLINGGGIFFTNPFVCIGFQEESSPMTTSAPAASTANKPPTKGPISLNAFTETVAGGKSINDDDVGEITSSDED